MPGLETLASAVGLGLPALNGVRLLIRDIQALKNAPKTIRSLRAIASKLESDLELIKAIDDEALNLLGAELAESTRATIRTCADACEEFRSELRRWTLVSGDGTLSLRARAKFVYLKQGPVKAMSEQLKNAQSGVTLMVGLVNLYSSLRQSRMTNEIREMISGMQAELSAAIDMSNHRMDVVQARANGGCLVDESGDEDDPEDSYDSDDHERGDDDGAGDEGEDPDMNYNLSQQLETMSAAIQASHRLLQKLLAMTQEGAIRNITGSYNTTYVTHHSMFGTNNNNSGFQAGDIHGNVSGLTFGWR